MRERARRPFSARVGTDLAGLQEELGLDVTVPPISVIMTSRAPRRRTSGAAWAHDALDLVGDVRSLDGVLVPRAAPWR